MDPNSGRLYPSLEAALEDGVEHPVEITGRPEDVQAISRAVANSYERGLRKVKRKMAKASRKANR